MKYISVFCLLFLASCAGQTTAQLLESSSNQNANIAPKEMPKPLATLVDKSGEDFDLCKDYEQIEIPKTNSPFGKVDFKNLTYPKIWEKGSVKLKNGCYGKEFTVPGLWVERYSLESIEFVDFNNDGVDEALIELDFFSAGGSSGVSENFLVYNLKDKKLNLLWKIATGARAYCGTKEYKLKDKQIILELFGKCTLKSNGAFDDKGKHTYDYSAFEYTRFVFGWSGNKFGVKSREIFPFPENDIKEYPNNKYKKQDENNN